MLEKLMTVAASAAICFAETQSPKRFKATA